MKAKKLATELHESYQAMVDSIEHFVVKEGKTLQQAFSAAEKNLEETKELSKEKVQQMSQDLKRSLQVLGEAAEGVSEAYKERLMFDMSYMNNAIWEKLQSIANSNTVELMLFTRTLNERAQAVITGEHLDAHQEHNQWASERAFWLDEVEFWKKGNEQALTKLVEIEKILKHQLSMLLEHSYAVRIHLGTDHKHEKVMSNAEQDPSSEVFKEADKIQMSLHKKERKSHIQHAKTHHDLRTRHFKVMAIINMFYKEMHKA